jgi:hypothetical protein
VHPASFGAAIRAIRVKRGWRQVDLAVRADVSARLIGRIERGDLDHVAFGPLVRVAEAMGGSASIGFRWHGGDLDRLMNARDSAMHEWVARLLGAVGGWDVEAEVSFSIYGERGVIDVLAWHAATRTLLVIELKTEIVDVNSLLGQVDRYRRLGAPDRARSRLGTRLRRDLGRRCRRSVQSATNRRARRHDAERVSG